MMLLCTAVIRFKDAGGFTGCLTRAAAAMAAFFNSAIRIIRMRTKRVLTGNTYCLTTTQRLVIMNLSFLSTPCLNQTQVLSRWREMAALAISLSKMASKYSCTPSTLRFFGHFFLDLASLAHFARATTYQLTNRAKR